MVNGVCASLQDMKLRTNQSQHDYPPAIQEFDISILCRIFSAFYEIHTSVVLPTLAYVLCIFNCTLHKLKSDLHILHLHLKNSPIYCLSLSEIILFSF